MNRMRSASFVGTLVLWIGIAPTVGCSGDCRRPIRWDVPQTFESVTSADLAIVVIVRSVDTESCCYATLPNGDKQRVCRTRVSFDTELTLKGSDNQSDSSFEYLALDDSEAQGVPLSRIGDRCLLFLNRSGGALHPLTDIYSPCTAVLSGRHSENLTLKRDDVARLLLVPGEGQNTSGFAPKLRQAVKTSVALVGVDATHRVLLRLGRDSSGPLQIAVRTELARWEANEGP